MSTLLIGLSTWEMAAVICGGFVLATLLGLLLCRPYAKRWIHARRNANDMVGFTLASFATLYGILLGLLAVEAYQDFSTAKDTVSKNALTLTTLYQDLDGLPQGVRAALREELRDYAREALVTYWSNDPPPPNAGASPRLRAALDKLLAFQPSSKGEEIVQAQGVQQVNALIEQRRMLIAAANDGIPTELWAVLTFGALLYMFLMCLLDMEAHVHLVLASATALFLGSVVFLITALDNPFHGGVTISAEPIRMALATLMRP